MEFGSQDEGEMIEHQLESAAADCPLYNDFTFNDFCDACASESPSTRLSAAQRLGDAAQRVDTDPDFTERRFFEALEHLLTFAGEVRSMALDKLREVFNELSVKSVDHLLDDLGQFSAPLLAKALDDGDEFEQNYATDTISHLVDHGLLRKEDIQNHLVPALFDLFNVHTRQRRRIDETQFTNMINIVAVLCIIANSIEQYPPAWAFHQFLARFSVFFTNDSCVIRKLSLSTMGKLAQRFGRAFTEHALVPHLVRACLDNNVLVRKACVEVFADLAALCTPATRRDVLTPHFLRLLGDQQRMVHLACTSQLGPFIATFANPKKTGVALRDGRLCRLQPRKKSGQAKVEGAKESTCASDHSDELKPLRSPKPARAHHQSAGSAEDEPHSGSELNEDQEHELSPDSPASADKLWDRSREPSMLDVTYEFEDDEPCKETEDFGVPEGFCMAGAPTATAIRANLSASESSSSDSSTDELDAVLASSPNCPVKSSSKVAPWRESLRNAENAARQEDGLFKLRRWPYGEEKNEAKLASLEDPEFCLDDITGQDLDDIDLDAEVAKFHEEQEMQNQTYRIEGYSAHYADLSDVEMLCATTEPNGNNTPKIPPLNLSAISDSLAGIHVVKPFKPDHLNHLTQQRTPRPITLFDADGQGPRKGEAPNGDAAVVGSATNPTDDALNANVPSAADSAGGAQAADGATPTAQTAAPNDLHCALSYWSNSLELDDLDLLNYRKRSQRAADHPPAAAPYESTWPVDEDPPFFDDAEPLPPPAATAPTTTAPTTTTDLQDLAQFPPIGGEPTTSALPDNEVVEKNQRRTYADVVKIADETLLAASAALFSSRTRQPAPTATTTNSESSTNEGFWRRRFDVFARKPLDFMKKTNILHQPPAAADDAAAADHHTDSAAAANPTGLSTPSALIAKIRPMAQNVTQRKQQPQTAKPAEQPQATVAPFRQLTERFKQRIQSATTPLDKKPANAAPVAPNDAMEKMEEASDAHKILCKKQLDRMRQFLTDDEFKELLHTKQDIVPQELLDAVAQVQQQDDLEKRDEHHAILARCFPAVVYTFGSDRWVFVKAQYLALAHHESSVVRVTMARSIHEIAQIIGQRKTDRDLVPVFRKFVVDVPQVQRGLLSHLHDFFKVCSEEVRLNLATELNLFDTCDSRCEWRARYEFIEQLDLMTALFKPYHVNIHLIPFALAFATDRIAEVRRGGVRMLATVLALLIRHEHSACRRSGVPVDAPNAMPLSNAFLAELQTGFWRSKVWRRRQSFAQMMFELVKRRLLSSRTFCKTFKQTLLELSEEAVSNVRQYFCQISEHLGRDRLEQADPDLAQHILTRLHDMAALDADLEIRMLSRAVLGTFDRHKHELDLSAREQRLRSLDNTASSNQLDLDAKMLQDADTTHSISASTSTSPDNFAVNENPEVAQRFNKARDFAKIEADIRQKIAATRERLAEISGAESSASSPGLPYGWLRSPRARKNAETSLGEELVRENGLYDDQPAAENTTADNGAPKTTAEPVKCHETDEVLRRPIVNQTEGDGAGKAGQTFYSNCMFNEDERTGEEAETGSSV